MTLEDLASAHGAILLAATTSGVQGIKHSGIDAAPPIYTFRDSAWPL